MQPYHNNRYQRPAPYDQEKDQPEQAAPAPVSDPDRFVVDYSIASVFLVRDELTGRVRESTLEFGDAFAIAYHLNKGGVYPADVLIAA